MRHEIEEVRRAWMNPGLNPRHHEQVKAQFRKAWPRLALAVDELVKAIQDPSAEERLAAIRAVLDDEGRIR